MTTRPHCPGSGSLPVMFNTESIYGACGVCDYMVVVRRDGKLRQHFVSRTKSAEQRQRKRAKKRMGVDPIPPRDDPAPRSDPDRRGDVEIVEEPIRFEDPPPLYYRDRVEDSTSDDKTRRELGTDRKRWRINVVIEWSRST